MTCVETAACAQIDGPRGLVEITLRASRLQPRISDFGFRIDGDLLPKLDSVPRSFALICLSQSREGRQALQDRYNWPDQM